MVGDRDLARDPVALAWAVKTASRRFPKATCLTQALTLKVLLTQAAHPAVLRIGVARGVGCVFEAHAWVEADGNVLIGELPDLERFTPLPNVAPPIDLPQSP